MQHVNSALLGVLESTERVANPEELNTVEELRAALKAERERSDKKLQEGFMEASKQVQALQNKLKAQREEFSESLDEGFSEALEELNKERNRPRPIHVSELRLSFQTLEQAMNLPQTARVVAVQEEDTKGVVKVRIASTTEAPEEYYLEHLSMVGEAYRHPEKYKAGPAGVGKGFTSGAAQEVADVSVTR